MGRWTRGAYPRSLLHCEMRLSSIWHRMRRQLGPTTIAVVDHGYGPVFSREVRTFIRPEVVAVRTEPESCRLAETVGGEIQSVTIWPGQAPEDLIDQLMKVPPTAAFVEAFGDVSSVLIFGPRGVDAGRLSALRAVVAALGPEDSWPDGESF